MAAINDTEIAWAAGLFEGEGCVIHWKPASDGGRARWYRRGLQVSSTDLDVLERFQGAMGGVGKVLPNRPRSSHHKLVWEWHLHYWPDVEACGIRLLPWLGLRRREAMLALLANPPKTRIRRHLGQSAKVLALTEGISIRTAYRRLWEAARQEETG